MNCVIIIIVDVIVIVIVIVIVAVIGIGIVIVMYFDCYLLFVMLFVGSNFKSVVIINYNANKFYFYFTTSC